MSVCNLSILIGGTMLIPSCGTKKTSQKLNQPVSHGLLSHTRGPNHVESISTPSQRNPNKGGPENTGWTSLQFSLQTSKSSAPSRGPAFLPRSSFCAPAHPWLGSPGQRLPDLKAPTGRKGQGLTMTTPLNQMAVAKKKTVPKWNPGKWKHGPKPA